MTFTLGRASLAAGPAVIRHSGDTVEWDFDIDSDTTSGDLVHAQVLRQQLLGLVGNDDEPVVPVTWSDDSDFDGFYRVLAVTIDPVTTYLDHGLMRCNVRLERISGGFAVAPVEITLLAPGRETDHTNANTSSTPFGAFASDSDYLLPSPFGSGTAVESADGDTLRFFANTIPAVGVYTIRYFARPARHYWGAATLEVLRDGTWYAVVGRQLPSGVERWRLSNGQIRVSLSGTSTGDLVFERWRTASSAWQEVGTLQRGTHSSGFSQTAYFGAMTIDSVLTYTEPVVLRNDPHGVVVRSYQEAGRSETFRIQPGRESIDMTLHNFSAQDHALSFGETATVLSTFSTSYGIRRSSTDANGNAWFVACAHDVTEDTTNGYIHLDTNAADMHAIAGVTDSSIASKSDREISAYLTGHTMRSQVIVR